MARHLIKFVSKSLGDTIGAMAAADAFRKKSGNEVHVIANLDASFFYKSYPEIRIFPYESKKPTQIAESGKWEFDNVIYDEHTELSYRFEKPLIKGYAEQLGIDSWERPRIDSSLSERPIKSRYVCFSMHSTAKCKHWNYPDGWDKLCRMLRKSGITPVCIDRHESFGIEGHWDVSPKSCVKRHGMDLSEMIRYISHSEFFIGLSSGLSWVAHAVGKPVVMISGVTSADNEFSEDTIRIMNQSVCHGCINNGAHKFDSGDWLWCPVHKGTESHFICTKSITPENVFEALEKLIK
jgi:autotransporter strand-loop-strand O-heptosyltransferase